MNELCLNQSSIQAELDKYVENGIEFIPDDPVLQVCDDWCKVINWSSATWDLTAWTSKCVKTKSDGQAAVNKFLANPYSTQARLDFNQCVDASINEPYFGIQW